MATDVKQPDNGAIINNYYDKLKKELKELIVKKKTVDKALNSLEESIYKHEGAYLEDTQNGNIIRGFDGYLKGASNRRRSMFSDNDRLFSLSSSTYLRTLQREPSVGIESDDAKAASTKKKRRKVDDSTSASEGEPPKRPRISFKDE